MVLQLGTNALFEKKGCRLGLITTKGFKDLMEIGTQRRPSLYNLQAQKPYPLVPSGLNCTVTERIRYDGSIETPLDEEETREVVRYLKAQGVAAIAVCTLFSFINPVHEERIEEIIHEEFPEAYVTISSKLAPEFREFSRMSTTVMNSYLGPVMKKYVNNFRESIAQLGIKVEPYVTQSNVPSFPLKRRSTARSRPRYPDRVPVLSQRLISANSAKQTRSLHSIWAVPVQIFP